MAPLTPGTTTALRGLVEGRVWQVQPATVLADQVGEVVGDGGDSGGPDSGYTALGLVPGTVCVVTTSTSSRIRHGSSRSYQWDEMPARRWGWSRHVWHGTRVVLHLRPGEWFALWEMRDGEGELAQWYVNFQDPLRRSRRGFVDTRDLELDLVVRPDGERIWKDREDFDEGCRHGVIDSARRAGVLAAAEELEAWLDAGRSLRDRYPPGPSFADGAPAPLPEGWIDRD
ncbi:MAG: DUF402 domain-containing protein [Actinomycetota bacterium]|nr:DUF402 domain-containing protein [Actinomycetota bacterium]